MNLDKMETYNGYVRTPADAIKLFEACRLGLLPRVQRRLSEKERQSIRSGSVFVWDEREAGMRRWTDGKSWSASRVSGSFLTYREMEGKRGGGFGGNSNGRRGAGKTPDSGRASDEDQDDGEPEGYRYKADGLMKQSFSITTSTGQHLHLISYYSRPQPGQAELPQPSTDPSLRAIVPVKGMYPESSMGEANQTPALTRAPMQQPPYMVAPPHPHHPAYPPHYQQPYGWPPSPAATPPYSHYAPVPYPHPHQMPPAHMAHHPHAPPPPPPPHYTHYPPTQHVPHHYDRPSMSPYHSGPPSVQQRPSPPSSHDSPPMTARNPHGPLPALPPVSAAHTSGHYTPASTTPPTRTLSQTPPRSSHSEATANGHKASLSALLHPALIKQEEDTGRSSPKTLPPLKSPGELNQDRKALRMLDRKFCL